MLFIPYLSSAFVPVATMPSWLRAVSEHQPITPVIETVRALLNDQPVSSGWLALAWSGGLLVVGLRLGHLAVPADQPPLRCAASRRVSSSVVRLSSPRLDVLPQVLRIAGARDDQHVRAPRERPRQPDLRGRARRERARSP